MKIEEIAQRFDSGTTLKCMRELEVIRLSLNIDGNVKGI
jgi:hypothetical protein